MKQQFLPVSALLLLLAATALAQSKDERKPTPVTGNQIKATLIDDAEQGHQTYHFSLQLKPGSNKAVLRVKMQECGGSVSVYVNTFANVFPNHCDTDTGIATGELDFVAKGTKPALITIYVSGGANERFEVDLSFLGGTGSASEPDQSLSCTYTDTFSLSNARPKYERRFEGLAFRKGTAQMLITTVNDEGTNISGTVYAEQTDKGQFNENFVLPVDGFGGTIGTPLTNEPVREPQQISGNGKGFIKVIFEQNGNSTNKTGRYTLTVKGTGIASCGNAVTVKAPASPGRKPRE